MSGTNVLYRGSTLGQALHKTLDEMEAEELLPTALKETVLLKFDKAVGDGLANLPNIMSNESRAQHLQGEIRDAEMITYKHVDNVWTFDLKCATFRGRCFNGDAPRGVQPSLKVERVRVVACDAKLFRKCALSSPRASY